MNSWTSQLRAALLALVLLGVICGGIYPLLVSGASQLIFPKEASGSLRVDGSGAVRGSDLIGQSFALARYFHPRPSAAGEGYDAEQSGGSNLAPSSRKLYNQIARRVAQYRTENGLPADAPVPADAVTASASGLDPHISIRNAQLQAGRIARERGVSLEAVQQLIEEHTEDSALFGRTYVHVLKLNAQLDTFPTLPPKEEVAPPKPPTEPTTLKKSRRRK